MPDRATSAAAAEWADVVDRYFAEVRFFSGRAVRLGARDAVMGEPG
jgi:hypothetical protein